MGTLLRDRILSLASLLDGLDEATFSRLGTTLVEEVGLLAQNGRSAPSPREALLARIDSVMNRHLHNPDLGPSDIAGIVGISVRYLHHLFAEEPDTFRTRLMAKRLDAVSNVLIKSPTSETTLTQVAFAHGFSSAAHFSRSFKQRFGVSPKDFRQRH
ncbi:MULTISPECIES: helix-turn-helix domain-containing protein [unclassified Ruegeria]|uniref:helix-turn-helix domain-containing protein n=1 Tax=unclassified Ruegeria TaxID=2625375 RepID=UPI001487C903|nr:MULTISPECIES: helix-turn-helix domain-containing protein [unclassified Ruegeria]